MLQWSPRPLVEHLREQERHNVTVITVGSKYEVHVGLQHPLTCKPWTTLSNPCNKVSGKYICKEVSCVFLLASFITASVIIASVCIQYIYVCNNHYIDYVPVYICIRVIYLYIFCGYTTYLLEKIDITPKCMIYKVKKIKLVTEVEGDQKAPFSVATTSRCREGRYSFPWIAPLYPWYVLYNAEC